MHEWALAESIITTVLEASKKEKLKEITKVNILLGELQQIEQDIFEYALNEIIKTQHKKLKNTEFVISTEKSTLTCTSCKHTWKFSDMKKRLNDEQAEAIHFIPEVAFVHTRCPKCGSPDFEITKGRGVSISSIQGKK